MVGGVCDGYSVRVFVEDTLWSLGMNSCDKGQFISYNIIALPFIKVGFIQ